MQKVRVNRATASHRINSNKNEQEIVKPLWQGMGEKTDSARNAGVSNIGINNRLRISKEKFDTSNRYRNGVANADPNAQSTDSYRFFRFCVSTIVRTRDVYPYTGWRVSEILRFYSYLQFTAFKRAIQTFNASTTRLDIVYSRITFLKV